MSTVTRDVGLAKIEFSICTIDTVSHGQRYWEYDLQLRRLQ